MKKLFKLAICLAMAGISLLFYSFISDRAFKNTPDIISISSGKISGVKSSESEVIAYKGIPFAAPPVGKLRWKAPQPVTPWPGVRKCDNFGPSPLQSKPVPFGVYTKEFLIPEQPISEDCLYLNVWTKAKKAGKRPVFVWIYGGGFMSGGAAVPIYDGEAMAKKGIVFVSVNYRVGVFGFLAHPELTKESPQNASGNYALLDQIAALKWVRKNIAAFGGDPGNVTICGQSAGSMSVNCLVASPAAKGLFNKAIAESGTLMVATFRPAINLHDAEQQGVQLAASLHITSIEELRNAPAADLMKFPAGYAPIVDGYVLPQSVPAIFAEGKENKVPLLIGWNADEGFVSVFKKKDAFAQELKDKYGADANEVLKYYPANTDEEAAASQTKLSRDMIFALPAYKWANVQSKAGYAPVYVYHFKHKLPAAPDFVKYGAFHTGEVAYVMDNLKFLNRPWLPRDHQLAKQLSAYWVNFISSGNPNGKDLPAWPEYYEQKGRVMVFDKISSAANLPDKAELDYMLSKLDR